jgi:hypothetical protein
LESLQASFCGKWVQGSIDCPLKHACGPLAVILSPWIFRMKGFNPPMAAAPSSKTVNSSEFRQEEQQHSMAAFPTVMSIVHTRQMVELGVHQCM